MQRVRLALIFIRPSLFSLTATLIVAGIVFGFISWTVVAQSPFFHEYFYGQYGVSTILNKTPDVLQAFKMTFFAQPASYNVTVLAVAAGIGLAVYIVLQLFSRAAADFSSTWRSVQQASGESKKTLEQEIELRLGFRIAMGVLWFFYLLLFIKLLFPFTVLIERFGINALPDLSGWLYGLLGFALLVTSLHVHVIFMRLIVLRPRVFGGEFLINY